MKLRTILLSLVFSVTSFYASESEIKKQAASSVPGAFAQKKCCPKEVHVLTKLVANQYLELNPGCGLEKNTDFEGVSADTIDTVLRPMSKEIPLVDIDGKNIIPEFNKTTQKIMLPVYKDLAFQEMKKALSASY